MKIWYGFGSEHSANLVMIGRFKTSQDAKKVMALIDTLKSDLYGKIEFGKSRDRYSDEVLNVLRKTDCFNLGPGELEQLFHDIHTSIDGKNIVVKTDEVEVSAFFKLMIEGGARVEIYSAHYYPDATENREE